MKNIDKAIDIMERAGKVSMDLWQDVDLRCSTTEEELHNCGSAACFAGWVAVSPEFDEDGGYADGICGYPILKGREKTEAIAEWLEIPIEESQQLCNTATYDVSYTAECPQDITAEDVIEVLERLKATGSCRR